MWRSKKFLLTVILSVVVLGAILGGYTVANADDEDSNQPPVGEANLLGKVAEIYEANTGDAIDADELQNAFSQARNELGIQARERIKERLVEEGVISQEQLDEFEQWLAERPEFPTDEFDEWLEARPEMPGRFGPGSEDGGKRFGSMFRHFRGFAERFGGGPHGWCVPDITEG